MGTAQGSPALEAAWCWSCGAFPPPVAGTCHSRAWHGAGGWISSGAGPLDVPSAISAFPFAPFHEKPRAKQCSWELLSVSKYLSRPEKRCAPISLDFFFILFCSYLRDCCRQETLTLVGSLLMCFEPSKCSLASQRTSSGSVESGGRFS